MARHFMLIRFDNSPIVSRYEQSPTIVNQDIERIESENIIFDGENVIFDGEQLIYPT